MISGGLIRDTPLYYTVYTAHTYRNAVFAEGLGSYELQHAVNGQVARESCTQVGSGRDTYCMDTHYLKAGEREGGRGREEEGREGRRERGRERE